MGRSSAWTPERRAKAAEAIRRNRPWAKSTGPRTPEGKAIASRNADKGGHRPRHRAQIRAMREMDLAAPEMIALMRAAHAEGNLAGECIDPDYDRSEAFLAAQARRERARARNTGVLRGEATVRAAVDQEKAIDPQILMHRHADAWPPLVPARRAELARIERGPQKSDEG